jgi:hypothetical protein
MPRVQLNLIVLSMALFVPRLAFAQGTRTSTGIQFPEEGGPLPREQMPEGGAEPVIKPPLVKPPPAGEIDCELNPTSQRCVATPRTPDFRSKFHYSFDGYLKVIAEWIQSDAAAPYVGQNGGFRIGNARLGFLAAYEDNLRAYISIDATITDDTDINTVNAPLAVGPRDAFFAYDLSRHAGLTVGRFKAPFDLSTLQDEGGRIFIDTPVESRGINAQQGFPLVGLTQDRQMGLMLARERLGLSSDGFDIGYAIALTNGRTTNLSLNDNNRPAGYSRFSFYWGRWFTVNLGGFTDTRTTGMQPNLFDEEYKGAEASAVAYLADLRLEAEGIIQRADYPTAGAPHVNSYGTHAQASYRFLGFEAAYRYAFYRPNHRFEVQDVTEHTFGLSYYASSLPLRFTVNGTLVHNEPGRQINNNRIGAMTVMNF